MTQTRRSTHNKIIALASDPLRPLKGQEIADILGVSRSTVTRALRKARPDLEDARERLAEYQQRIGEELPVEARVRRYKELVEQNSQLMVSLKALERVDALDGIVTAKERKEVETGPQQPMFVMPQDSHVVINVTKDNCPPGYRDQFEEPEE